MLPSVISIVAQIHAGAPHANELTLQPNMSVLTPGTSMLTPSTSVQQNQQCTSVVVTVTAATAATT